jgi:hypothetical protein
MLLIIFIFILSSAGVFLSEEELRICLKMVRTRRRAKDLYPDPSGLVDDDENEFHEEENNDNNSGDEVHY